jgi:hypothetical protein
VNRTSKKKKEKKKISAKKEKYLKFEQGKDDRITSRTRVQPRDVDQSLINENDQNISMQMRRLPRNKDPPEKRVGRDAKK